MSEINYEFDNYVSKEEYTRVTGIDLEAELTSMVSSDVTDSIVERFINGVEEWCKSRLQERYAFDGTINDGNQTERFKKGVIYQIQYILRNGNISNDSGFISATGQIIDTYLLDKIGLSSNAFTEFRLGGMANLRRY